MTTAISEVETENLNVDESRRLVELERKIQQGLLRFIELGEALEIRDSRLYRREHRTRTFEDHCRKDSKMSRLLSFCS
jgi:hypothetical protein